MGCGKSQFEQDTGPINTRALFNQYQLTKLIDANCVFESELEDEIFMAANVLRYNTGVFVNTVKNVKANFPQCTNARNTDKLIEILQQNE